MNRERKIIPNGEPKIIAEAKIGALVVFPVLVDSGDGHKEKMFEKFIRPPGTRIIAEKDNKIFLQKEYRLELNNKSDWRLPGGKVMESFGEYKSYIGKEIPEKIIIEAGKKELREEAKMDSENIKIFKKSSCGSLVEWDLYYLVAKDLKDFSSNHNEGEEIVDGKWFSYDEIEKMCIAGEIDEDRTVAVLYQFIKSVG